MKFKRLKNRDKSWLSSFSSNRINRKMNGAHEDSRLYLRLREEEDS